MKTTCNIAFATTLIVLAAGGCKKHDAASPANGSAGSASTTGSGGSAAMGSAAMAGSAAPMGSAATPDVPTPADFEAQAATDITDKNLDSSLDEVEKELGK